jgi:hypothetical protein
VVSQPEGLDWPGLLDMSRTPHAALPCFDHRPAGISPVRAQARLELHLTASRTFWILPFFERALAGLEGGATLRSDGMTLTMGTRKRHIWPIGGVF